MLKPIYSLFILCLFFGFKTQGQNALSFDGVDDRVNCGNHSSVQLSGTSITIEAWIKADSWATNVWGGNIVNKEIWTPQNGYMLRCGAGGQLNFNLGNGPTWNELTSSTAVLSLNTWHHVAGTYDGSYMRIYVDGVQVDSLARSISFSDATGANLTIGDYVGSGRYFHGTIDEVRIWNIARTKSEIVQNMNDELCGNEAGLVAYYNFNQGTAGGSNASVTTLTDEIGNNNGTLQNFSLASSSSNWVTGRPLTPSGSTRSMKDTICSGLTYNFGTQMLTSSGSYQETFPDSKGCDSVVNLDLHVKPVEVGVTQFNYTLTAKAQGSQFTYQWIDCQDNSAIAGETFRSYLATANGSYAVVIATSECTDTSACYDITGIGLEDEKRKLNIDVYPIPFSDQLTVNWKSALGHVELILTDLSGKEVLHQIEEGSDKAVLNLETLPSGVYLLNIEIEDRYQTFKVVK